MIIRVSDALRALITSPKDKYHALLEHPAFHAERTDISHLSDIVPLWLSEVVFDGSIIVISPSEYEELPDELREHIQVLKH